MICHVLTVYRLTFDLGQSYRFRACTLGICIRLILSAFFKCISNFRVIAAFLYRSLMQRTLVYVIMAKCVLLRMAQNKYFAGLILGLKPGFDDTFSSLAPDQ